MNGDPSVHMPRISARVIASIVITFVVVCAAVLLIVVFVWDDPQSQTNEQAAASTTTGQSTVTTLPWNALLSDQPLMAMVPGLDATAVPTNATVDCAGNTCTVSAAKILSAPVTFTVGTGAVSLAASGEVDIYRGCRTLIFDGRSNRSAIVEDDGSNCTSYGIPLPVARCVPPGLQPMEGRVQNPPTGSSDRWTKTGTARVPIRVNVGWSGLPLEYIAFDLDYDCTATTLGINLPSNTNVGGNPTPYRLWMYPGVVPPWSMTVTTIR